MTPPGRAEHVVLRLPASGDALPARMGDPDGELLTLVLTAAAAPPALAGDAGLIEYTTARGVHRVAAEIVGPDAAAPEVVRVRAGGPEQVVQRRDFARVDAFLAVRAKVAGGVQGIARTTTLNVSAGGVLLQDPFGLPPGAVLELDLELDPPGAPVHARGRVVREVSPDVKGVLIDTIASADRERLVRYVTARERLALQRIARPR